MKAITSQFGVSSIAWLIDLPSRSIPQCSRKSVNRQIVYVFASGCRLESEFDEWSQLLRRLVMPGKTLDDTEVAPLRKRLGVFDFGCGSVEDVVEVG